jgi:hypothetical protein
LWQDRVNRFERSGLSGPVFCAKEGLSLPSFYSWRRRLRRPSGSPVVPSFLPVRITLPGPAVELVLPTGTVLRLAPGCDLTFVRSLVDALGGAAC